MVQLRPLFASELVHVEDYRCDLHPSDHSGEEWALRHEIVFPRLGTFLRYDAAGKVVADANQILFFHRHQPYQISHPVSGGDCSTIFAVAPPVLLDILRVYDPGAADHPDSPFPVSHTLVQPRQRYAQVQLFQAAFQANSADTLEIEERILMLLAEVLRDVYRAPHRSTATPRNATIQYHQEQVDQVKLVLAERFCEKLKLSEIAAAVHASPYFLCRIFKQGTGLSIHQYMQRLRLLHALEQLTEHPRTDLTHLALTLGFASHSHFTRAFAREFGAPPSAIRFTRSQRMSKNLKA